METAFRQPYIYIVGLSLMLLIVLTSISVVVAARQKQKVKSTMIRDASLKIEIDGRVSARKFIEGNRVSK